MTIVRPWASMSASERRAALKKLRRGRDPADVAAEAGSYTGKRRSEAGKKGWEARDDEGRQASMANLEKGRVPRRRFTLKKAVLSSTTGIGAFAASSSLVIFVRNKSIGVDPLMKTLMGYGIAGGLAVGTWRLSKPLDQHVRYALTGGTILGGVIGPRLFGWMANGTGVLATLGKTVHRLGLDNQTSGSGTP